MIAALAARIGIARARARTEKLLRELARVDAPAAAASVLVDGVWDNPNHWMRYSFLRAALGLAGAREIAITGPYNARRVGRTLRRLGVREVVSLPALADRGAENRRRALEILGQTRRADDVLKWQLPHGVPAALVYDGILKRQRLGLVDVADRRLAGFVAEALDCITAAERLLERYQFDLLTVSHPCNFLHVAVLWLALRRGIPALLLLGGFGTLRLTKLRVPEDVFRYVDVPDALELAALSSDRRERLEQLGQSYLARRLEGQTSDAGALQAYRGRPLRMDRASIARAFDWDAGKPIVAVYAPNWFDFPHGTGLVSFRDYQDWIEVTAQAARANPGVQWLFKRHPWDVRYAGVSLSDVAPGIETHPHMRLVPDDWNGAALVEQVDGLVTCQGTSGIEFAALGRPVLLAHEGWYDHGGFALRAGSKEEYVALLGRAWWTELSLAETTRRARAFAGIYFGHPAWQPPLLFQDDSVQWEIYARLPELLERGAPALQREIATIREWYASPSRTYHTFKMLTAEDYSS